jgi:hypothetical protein
MQICPALHGLQQTELGVSFEKSHFKGELHSLAMRHWSPRFLSGKQSLEAQ